MNYWWRHCDWLAPHIVIARHVIHGEDYWNVLGIIGPLFVCQFEQAVEQTVGRLVIWEGMTSRMTIDPFQKSHKALDKYPTMRHCATEMRTHDACTFLLQNGALWDMILVHYGMCATGLLNPNSSPVSMVRASCESFVSSGGRFKNAYELLTLRALRISMLYKSHIFQCMGKIFCVEFQRVPLKFHTKYLTHTLKDKSFMKHWNFKSS